MARVLLEYNGRRVDIKDPVSSKMGKPDNSNDLKMMIGEALNVLGLSSPFKVNKEVSNG